MIAIDRTIAKIGRSMKKRENTAEARYLVGLRRGIDSITREVLDLVALRLAERRRLILQWRVTARPNRGDPAFWESLARAGPPSLILGGHRSAERARQISRLSPICRL